MLTSLDERLKGVLVNANSCCNPFARMPKEYKEVFLEALTFYNFFFEQEVKKEEEKIVMEKLFELLKIVGNHNNTGAKGVYIQNHWEQVKSLAHELARARIG